MNRKQISHILRAKIFKKYDYKCCSCKTTENLVIHHIVPIGAGGTDEESNLCLVCADCHKKIHANYNHINFCNKPPGRKRIKRPGYKKAIEDFFFNKRGLMSVGELKTALGISERSDLKQNKLFLEEMHELGIEDYRINGDFMKRFNRPDGSVCGWIKFLDGKTEDVFYSVG